VYLYIHTHTVYTFIKIKSSCESNGGTAFCVHGAKKPDRLSLLVRALRIRLSISQVESEL